MATQQQPVGPYDYLASGIERSFVVISKGRAEKRQRQENVADVDAERAFRKQQLDQEIALRASIEDKQTQARFDLASQASQDAADRQQEMISAQRTQNEAQMTQRANERRDDVAYRDEQARLQREEHAATLARSIGDNAIKTGIIPTLAGVTAQGFSEDQAVRIISDATMAREDYTKSPEYQRQVRREESAIEANQALTTDRASRTPREQIFSILEGLNTDEQGIQEKIRANGGQTDPADLLRLQEIGRLRVQYSALNANRPLTQSGAGVVGTYRGSVVPTSGDSAPRPSGRTGNPNNSNAITQPTGTDTSVHDAEIAQGQADLARIQNEAQSRGGGGHVTQADVDAANAAKARIAAAQAARTTAIAAVEASLSDESNLYLQALRDAFNARDFRGFGSIPITPYERIPASEKRRLQELVRSEGRSASAATGANGNGGGRFGRVTGATR